MMLKNGPERWGAVAKLLHWTIAVLIIGTSIFILHVNDSTYWFTSSPEIFITYIHWHKAVGLIALLLVFARIAWRRSQRVPTTAELSYWEKRWSHRTHVALYVLMVIVPLTGWLSSSFFGSSTNVFGLFVIPPIVPKNELGVTIFYWAHFALAWAILSLVAFHVAGALYHHFVRKDGVLRAMLP